MLMLYTGCPTSAVIMLLHRRVVARLQQLQGGYAHQDLIESHATS